MTATSKPINAPVARRSVDEATAWIDSHIQPLGQEKVPATEAAGRILATAVAASRDEPAQDRAAIDGLAVRADETIGANAYNPLGFRLVEARGPLAPGCAARVMAGDAIPAGADAVVPFDYVQPGTAERCEVIEPVVRGNEVEPAGSHYRRGTALLQAGRRLGGAELALLAQAGIGEVAVVRRPRVALSGNMVTMLRRLIERDGAIVAAADADVAISTDAAQNGTLAIREIALYPGQATSLGLMAGRLAVVLPSEAAACLWAYEIVVGRAIRRLAGGDPELPFQSRAMTTVRKIVSRIGAMEICPVRCLDETTVEPLAEFPRESLVAAAAADGFVILPEASEGFAAGASVIVYFHRS